MSTDTHEEGPQQEADATHTPDSDGPSVVDVMHAPSRLTQAGAILATIIGVGLTAPFALLAIPFAIAGVVIVAGSVTLTYSRGWLAVGTGLVGLGAIISGAYGAVPVELLLIGTSVTILAFDIGQYGIVVGEQLGRKTQTHYLEAIHALLTVITLIITNTVVYFLYLFGGGGRPASAVSFLVIGAIVLTWLYRR